MKDFDYVKVYNVNPLYFIIDKVDEYIEKNNENRYLALVSTDKSKGIVKIYTELWDKTRNLIEIINDKTGEYEEGFTKIKFNSHDDLSLIKY